MRERASLPLVTSERDDLQSFLTQNRASAFQSLRTEAAACHFTLLKVDAAINERRGRLFIRWRAAAGGRRRRRRHSVVNHLIGCGLN